MNTKHKYDEMKEIKNVDTGMKTVFTLEVVHDEIVEEVKKEWDLRSSIGQSKYGFTLENNNHDDFTQHLKEELMDAILYLQKLQKIQRNHKTELVKFGNYLLSDKRNSDKKHVTDADLENYKI